MFQRDDYVIRNQADRKNQPPSSPRYRVSVRISTVVGQVLCFPWFIADQKQECSLTFQSHSVLIMIFGVLLHLGLHISRVV